jgi:hypothetical protein
VVYAVTDGSFTAAFATLALGPIAGAVLAVFIREPSGAPPAR